MDSKATVVWENGNMASDISAKSQSTFSGFHHIKTGKRFRLPVFCVKNVHNVWKPVTKGRDIACNRRTYGSNSPLCSRQWER